MKTSCSAYKGQTEDLVATSKKLAPGEEEEDSKVFLLKKRKTSARPSSKASTRAIPATRQATIPTGVIIKKTAASLLEVTPTPVAASLNLVALLLNFEFGII